MNPGLNDNRSIGYFERLLSLLETCVELYGNSVLPEIENDWYYNNSKACDPDHDKGF